MLHRIRGVTPEDYQLASDLFHEVFPLDADERARVLRERDPGPDVLAEVESLLGEATKTGLEGGQLNAVIQNILHDPGRAQPVPDAIGPFRIVRKLGQGGMGVVYEAEQQSPSRTVAIKLLRAAGFGTSAALRFEREAELLGRLQHPGIAQIFQSGTTDVQYGDPASTYIAMELIDGVPITEYARRERLSVRQRIELLVDLIRAVHYAHLRGVLHRDLKPSNVLVNSEGQVKVIDFGIARALDDDPERTQATLAGQVVGTLAYMSPEQVCGDVDAIDARTDVFALGVLAYELLGERLPHEVSERSLADAVRIICDEPTPPLSRFAPECRGDVELIVAKALAKEPERRYQSALALAEDFERLARFEPVTARPPSMAYHMKRFARRHRGLVGGGVIAAAALVLGAAVALHFAIRNADLAEAELAARTKADDKAREAQRAQREAVQRAEAMVELAKYQDSLVRDINLQEMGRTWVEDVLASQRRSLERRNLGPVEIGLAQEELAAHLDVVNPTEVARATLRRTIFDRAIVGIEERFPPDSMSQLAALVSLGRSLHDFGFMDKAQSAYQRALDGSTRGEALPDTVFRARLGLGQILHRLDQLPESEAMLRACVAQALDEFGEGSEQVTVALTSLALTRGSQGDQREAEELHGRAVAAAESQERHDAASLFALSGWAAWLSKHDRFEELLELQRQIYEGQLRLRGEEDLNTLVARGHIAGTLLTLRQLDEAREIAGEVHRAMLRTVGPAHLESLGVLETLATTYLFEQRIDEAAPLVRELVNGCRALYGVEDERTLGQLHNLVQIEIMLGRLREARPLAEELYEATRAALDPGDSRRFASTAMLRDVYVGLRDQVVEEEFTEKIEELDAELEGG